MERRRAGEDEGIYTLSHPHTLTPSHTHTLTPSQVGGNSRAKEFFTSRGDVKPGMSLTDKYDTKTAALYRDKVGPYYTTHKSVHIVHILVYMVYVYTLYHMYVYECTNSLGL